MNFHNLQYLSQCQHSDIALLIKCLPQNRNSAHDAPSSIGREQHLAPTLGFFVAATFAMTTVQDLCRFAGYPQFDSIGGQSRIPCSVATKRVVRRASGEPRQCRMVNLVPESHEIRRRPFAIKRSGLVRTPRNGHDLGRAVPCRNVFRVVREVPHPAGQNRSVVVRR